MRTARARAILIVAMLLTGSRTHAQSATAGTPVAATHLAAESNAGVIADGAGGAYVGFKIAYRGPSLPAEIAVAHVLASAGRDPDWDALPMVPAGSLAQSNPLGPSRVLRAPGGTVLAFADFALSTPADIVRQVGAHGANLAYPGYQPGQPYNTFTVLPRSDGGALILSKALGSINCMATVVTPSGTGSEVVTPLALGNGTYATVGGDRMAAAPSGTDGAIAAILLPQINNTLTGADIVAVRVDGTGHPLWVPAHRVLSGAVRDQMEPVAVSDGADGAIIAWKDLRNTATDADIYATRLLASGAVATGWTAGGKAIVSATRAQYAPAMASDDAGGAWIAWVDDRDTLSGPNIFFTHVLASGTPAAGFAAGGRALCAATGIQSEVQVVRDGSGGLFALWLDARDGETDLYAQHLDTSGNPTAGWAANGVAVCTDPTAQSGPALGEVSNGRAIAAWSDPRTGTAVVYAAALDAAKGVLGVPAPVTARLALAPRTNPGRGAVDVRIDAAGLGEVRVQVFDVSGRLRAERSLSGPAQAFGVRFAGLEPGVYLVSALQDGARSLARVAVLR